MNKNEKLGNAAVATLIAQNPKEAKKAVNVGLWIVGGTLLAVGGMAFYSLYWKHRFKPLLFDPHSQKSNVSEVQAKEKADALYLAMKGAGTNDTKVFAALKGVNKNGFIAIYNAFGKREPASVAEKFGFGFLFYKDYLTLTQYLKDDLSPSDLKTIRNMIGGIDMLL